MTLKLTSNNMMKITLTAQDVIKRYDAVVALSDGNLEAHSGEVLALMGANGSGKSTLSKIITGVVAPDQGQLLLNGQRVRFSSPVTARKHGIVAVYQELSLVPDMTVAENIWLTHEPRWGKLFVRADHLYKRTLELLGLFTDTIRASLRPDDLVSTLSPDEKQIVEILKALSQQPNIIILDEATASLDSKQVARLFELVALWKEQGKAIIFISHRMEEVFRIADRVTVLRSGKTVTTAPLSTFTPQSLVNAMIEGGTVERKNSTRENTQTKVCLSVDDLRTHVLHDVHFQLRSGELLGLGGLRGQGQSDVLLALFGAVRFHGTIRLWNKEVHFSHPRKAMRHGLAFVPGDRGTEGLLTSRSIFENLLLPSWSMYGQFLRMTKAQKDTHSITQQLNMVMRSIHAPVNSLSGGNAQKVVLGKWLLRSPKILLLDDPTKGIDVGAKGEFYKLLTALQAKGTAIILYSSDDEELLGLCDRVLVLHDGKIHAELTGNTLTRTELVAASMGTEQRGFE